MLSVGKIAGLALVFMLAVLAASLVSPAQVMAAPLNQCSSAELQYGGAGLPISVNLGRPEPCVSRPGTSALSAVIPSLSP